jgi:hypothetical protein
MGRIFIVLLFFSIVTGCFGGPSYITPPKVTINFLPFDYSKSRRRYYSTIIIEKTWDSPRGSLESVGFSINCQTSSKDYHFDKSPCPIDVSSQSCKDETWTPSKTITPFHMILKTKKVPFEGEQTVFCLIIDAHVEGHEQKEPDLYLFYIKYSKTNVTWSSKRED